MGWSCANSLPDCLASGWVEFRKDSGKTREGQPIMRIRQIQVIDLWERYPDPVARVMTLLDQDERWWREHGHAIRNP